MFLFSKKANQETIESLRAVTRFSKLIIGIFRAANLSIRIGENTGYSLTRGTHLNVDKLYHLINKIESSSVDISQNQAEKYLSQMFHLLLGEEVEGIPGLQAIPGLADKALIIILKSSLSIEAQQFFTKYVEGYDAENFILISHLIENTTNQYRNQRRDLVDQTLNKIHEKEML